ncbi:MAG: hypothetical protein BWK80_40685 [Desulfobacteraceae bacterium IS3]|nr:MAG: hypothetical protein BWK80_40685 [Desulfobacteraceae bacterium IS3]
MKLTLTNIIKKLQNLKPFLEKYYGVDYLGVFGSFVRNEQTATSDLDVLVTFYKIPDLFKFIEIENYLSDLMGVKVDLVTKDTLKPRIGKQILSEVIPI